MDFLALKSGTDIRGVASDGVKGQIIQLTDPVVTAIASGFLCWCESHLEKPVDKLSIAIGHDSRISADRISSCLKTVFLKHGCHVLDCGLASTPSMFMAVVDIPCDCAIEITASHHPFNRNGLKFFTKDGGLDSPDITEILSACAEGKTPTSKHRVGGGFPLGGGVEAPFYTRNSPSAQHGQSPLPSEGGYVESSEFMKRYAEILRNKIIDGVSSKNTDFPLKGFHIVVDAGNGAGGFYAHDVLAPLGADISGSVFLEPDGMFPNHVPNPENEDAMKAISKATIDAHADLGVIFDTDVDRGAAVDRHGVEISRNRLVALASAIALEDYPGGTVVTDSITSDGLKEYIESTLGGVHHRFRRGYKNVINEALRLNESGIDCPLAIETSGHAAMKENYFLDDGAYLVTKLIIKMATLKQKGKNLEELLKDLKEPKEAKELRFSLKESDFRKEGEKILADLKNYANLNHWEIAPDNHEGLRISFPPTSGDGWFLLRLSVHDPIMPLNIESNKVGGVQQILAHVKAFFDKYHYFTDANDR